MLDYERGRSPTGDSDEVCPIHPESRSKTAWFRAGRVPFVASQSCEWLTWRNCRTTCLAPTAARSSSWKKGGSGSCTGRSTRSSPRPPRWPCANGLGRKSSSRTPCLKGPRQPPYLRPPVKICLSWKACPSRPHQPSVIRCPGLTGRRWPRQMTQPKRSPLDPLTEAPRSPPLASPPFCALMRKRPRSRSLKKRPPPLRPSYGSRLGRPRLSRSTSLNLINPWLLTPVPPWQKLPRLLSRQGRRDRALPPRRYRLRYQRAGPRLRPESNPHPVCGTGSRSRIAVSGFPRTLALT